MQTTNDVVELKEPALNRKLQWYGQATLHNSTTRSFYRTPPYKGGEKQEDQESCGSISSKNEQICHSKISLSQPRRE